MPVQVPESLDEAESEPTVLCGETRVIQVQSSSFVSIFAKRKHPPGPALYVPIARTIDRAGGILHTPGAGRRAGRADPWCRSHRAFNG